MIGVKSTEEKIVAKYDGREYVFQPGAVTAVSEDAARHIFGYGMKEKTSALLRLGWLPNGAQMDQAIQRLNKVQFLAAEEPRFKEEESASLPRKVSDATKPGELSADEKAIAGTLAHQEGPAKQFRK